MTYLVYFHFIRSRVMTVTAVTNPGGRQSMSEYPVSGAQRIQSGSGKINGYNGLSNICFNRHGPGAVPKRIS